VNAFIILLDNHTKSCDIPNELKKTNKTLRRKMLFFLAFIRFLGTTKRLKFKNILVNNFFIFSQLIKLHVKKSTK